MSDVQAKQPFELPDFYVPWPARLNPNLAAARAHTRQWAIAMGLVRTSADDASAALWSEDQFDAMDFALLCASTHPDAPVHELDLVTDWYAWSFYFDDSFCAVYKSAADREGGKDCTDRLAALMPLESGSVPPEPATPLERGLSDLWARTIPGTSASWRRRFFTGTWQFIEEALRELGNIRDQRVANPIEYIELRRKSGAADPWVTTLVERASAIEIPARITDTRPMQVLRAAFADAIHLRNDLFSYQREIQQEGELANCVLVLERFLDVGTQRAADLVNDLLTSRLQQFENTAVLELPLLIEEHGLDPAERGQVLTYVRGLQDWQSGCHAWHLRSGRYMKPSAPKDKRRSTYFSTLPGSAAVPLAPSPDALGLQRFKSFSHVPYTPVAPLKLPKFHLPLATEHSPHLEAARRHSRQWARRMGMLDCAPGLAGFCIWDDRAFDRADAALCAALIEPEASGPELDLLTQWLVWGIHADDYVQKVHGQTRDVVGAKALCDRLSALLSDDSSVPAAALHPVERGLADLWSRTTKALSAEARIPLRNDLQDLIESWLWRLLNLVQNRIPDPVDYLEMRRRMFGARLTLRLFWLAHGSALPAAIARTRTMTEIENSAADHACLTNDLFSYQKELEFEGDLNNFVLVVQHFLDTDPQSAADVVGALMDARMRQFEHVAATELPRLLEDANLDAQAQACVHGYVRKLRQWMGGVLTWHTRAGRYQVFEPRSPWNPARLSGQPTGPGTAASRLAAMLRERGALSIA